MENLNGLEWGAIITALLYIGDLVVKATPTEKDDNIFNVIRKVLTFYVKNKKKGGGTH